MSVGRRGPRAFRPRMQRLEDRALMATINLANVDTAPYGVGLVGGNNNAGAGASVAAVGDVNGDGFQDFVIGAPTINTSGGTPALGNGVGASAYLVFGSATLTAAGVPAVADFLALSAAQRYGALSNLGNTSQTNPITGQPGFNFDGLIFQSPTLSGSQIGAAAAGVGDVNGDGFNDFMIGAPNVSTVAGAEPGRAYLIYGGPNLERANKVVDLTNPLTFPDLQVLTFVGNGAGSLTGLGLAQGGNVLPDGLPTVAIGAPGASSNGLVNNGAVYLIDGSVLRPARTEVLSLATVGQVNGLAGVTFIGANNGALAGRSLGGAFDFNGDGPSELLIGAPGTATAGTGTAYMIYGGNLAALATTNGGLLSIPLTAVGGTVPGLALTGSATGDQTGFAVATAGDFNNDGFGDILIGSPQFNSGAGRVNLIYGLGGTTLSGVFALSSLPPSLGSVELDGATSGSLAGYSVSPVGDMNGDSINEILIGSPGVATSVGAAYVIPGNEALFGTFSLDPNLVQAAPVFGTYLSTSSPTGLEFLGTSVSGNLFAPPLGRTIDSDSRADFLVGAPGFGLNTGGNDQGIAYALEGAFIPLAVPVVTPITVTIGVDSPTPPFVINAKAPADLLIYVFSIPATATTAAFLPADDLNPAAVTVNGVAFPGATIANVGDLNGDGLDDAAVTVSPRSALALANGTQQLTFGDRTLAASPFGVVPVVGSATITVTGGGGGGGGGVPSIRIPNTFGFPSTNAAVPPLGESLVPTVQSLSHLIYKPIPVTAAVRPYLPTGLFLDRILNFTHPGRKQHGPLHRGTDFHTLTLPHSVFTRGRFPNGKLRYGRVIHQGNVVPRVGLRQHV